MTDAEFSLHPIAYVRSPLKARAAAPKQGSEGAPNAWIEVSEAFVDGLLGLRPAQEVILITWLHHSRRDLLRVHPRDDPTAPLAGVFATRSADRPNPLGLHPVRILRIDGRRLEVGPLEAVAAMARQCLGRHGLPPKRPPYTVEVVIAVPDGVILQHELAREWGIRVERYRGRLIELPVAQSPDCGCGRRAVLSE